MSELPHDAVRREEQVTIIFVLECPRFMVISECPSRHAVIENVVDVGVAALQRRHDMHRREEVDECPRRLLAAHRYHLRRVSK